jgi:3-keto-disaccharide hydrolase
MRKKMKSLWSGGMGCGLLLLGVASCSTPSAPKEAIELFNGKDLDGWQQVLADPQVKLSEVWSVQDGILTCQGKPLGFLYRGPAVTSFRLVVEYRWPPGSEPGNSGIFSRITEPLKPLPCTFECQLKHGSAGDVLGLQRKPIASGQPRYFEVKTGPLAGTISGVRKLLDAEKPPGQWNRVEILAQGPRYQVWINGKLVNDVSGLSVVSGPVGVQSEGGVVQFRRVRLTPLD